MRTEAVLCIRWISASHSPFPGTPPVTHPHGQLFVRRQSHDSMFLIPGDVKRRSFAHWKRLRWSQRHVLAWKQHSEDYIRAHAGSDVDRHPAESHETLHAGLFIPLGHFIRKSQETLIFMIFELRKYSMFLISGNVKRRSFAHWKRLRWSQRHVLAWKQHSEGYPQAHARSDVDRHPADSHETLHASLFIHLGHFIRKSQETMIFVTFEIRKYSMFLIHGDVKRRCFVRWKRLQWSQGLVPEWKTHFCENHNFLTILRITFGRRHQFVPADFRSEARKQ